MRLSASDVREGRCLWNSLRGKACEERDKCVSGRIYQGRKCKVQGFKNQIRGKASDKEEAHKGGNSIMGECREKAGELPPESGKRNYTQKRDYRDIGGKRHRKDYFCKDTCFSFEAGQGRNIS